MAALIEEKTGQSVELIPGSRGIFDVMVSGDVVARKTLDGFPTEEACLSAVANALA
ncbi:MAG: hypothetical protein GWP91_12680 [Rhodobacterales bacterium]|nr:hypothetical protein [Rhodobacterales bacterium]